MADLRLVSQSMFYKKDWDKIPDTEKETCFFIFNRYFSKRYKEQAQLLNDKSIDKVTAMNLWYHFLLDKPYPKWFWSKSPSVDKPVLPKKDFELLLTRLSIREFDLNFLIENHFEFIKEELKYYKSLEK